MDIFVQYNWFEIINRVSLHHKVVKYARFGSKGRDYIYFQNHRKAVKTRCRRNWLKGSEKGFIKIQLCYYGQYMHVIVMIFSEKLKE